MSAGERRAVVVELVIPQIKTRELTNTYGKIVIEPLERGYGTNIGNSLRRVILSSIPGAAVTRVRFDGKYHEYDTIDGVKEDILEIILNIKELSIRLRDKEKKRMYLDYKGQGEVTASDIEAEDGVEIINKDQHIAMVNEDGNLSIEMEVEPGIGYRPSERNVEEDSPLGVIPLDSDFSPVESINFEVESTRVGERTDYERLILELETKGQIKPEEVLSKAAEILRAHFDLFKDFAQHPFGAEIKEEEEEPEELSMTLEKLDFDQRAVNLLKGKDIVTLEDLLEKTGPQLTDVHGFGEKTLEKVKERLKDLGYSLKEDAHET